MATENFDLNALLDGTLEDLADLPEFKPYAPGTYKVRVTVKDKTAPKDQVNKHPGYELGLKLLEVVELASPNSEPPTPEAEVSVLYLLDNEMGQGAFKKILISASETFGVKSPRELIADMHNTEALVITKTRQNKDKTQTYTDIVEIQFV